MHWQHFVLQVQLHRSLLSSDANSSPLPSVLHLPKAIVIANASQRLLHWQHVVLRDQLLCMPSLVQIHSASHCLVQPGVMVTE